MAWLFHNSALVSTCAGHAELRAKAEEVRGEREPGCTTAYLAHFTHLRVWGGRGTVKSSAMSTVFDGVGFFSFLCVRFLT